MTPSIMEQAVFMIIIGPVMIQIQIPPSTFCLRTLKLLSNRYAKVTISRSNSRLMHLIQILRGQTLMLIRWPATKSNVLGVLFTAPPTSTAISSNVPKNADTRTLHKICRAKGLSMSISSAAQILGL